MMAIERWGNSAVVSVSVWPVYTRWERMLHPNPLLPVYVRPVDVTYLMATYYYFKFFLKHRTKLRQLKT